MDLILLLDPQPIVWAIMSVLLIPAVILVVIDLAMEWWTYIKRERDEL